jgi:hypothetical protein
MSKRVVGAVLLGTGLVILATGAVSSLVVTPMVAKLPTGGELPTTVLDAPNATFVHAKLVDNAPKVELAHANLRATTTIQPVPAATAAQAGAVPANAVVWTVAQQVNRTDTGEPVSGSQTRIALDRGTGAAVTWGGQCYADQVAQTCQPGAVTFTGQLYAFPFNTRKKAYQYFDSTLRTALPIEYQGTETVNGLATYRFTQTVPETRLELDPQLLATVLAAMAPAGGGAPAPSNVSMQYSSTRTLWVEPVTGSIVDYEEKQRRTLALGPGVQFDLLNATFRYTPETRRAVADEAGRGRTIIQTLRWYGPAGLGGLGLLLVVLGIVLVRRRARVS